MAPAKPLAKAKKPVAAGKPNKGAVTKAKPGQNAVAAKKAGKGKAAPPGGKRKDVRRKGKGGKKGRKGKKKRKKRKKKKRRCPIKRRRKPLKRRCTDVFTMSALINRYYIAHGVPDALKSKKKTKGKRGGDLGLNAKMSGFSMRGGPPQPRKSRKAP